MENDKFNIHELNLNRDLRKKKKFKTFNVFFKKCLKKIKSLSDYREYCSYQIPLIAPGLPLFNRQECLLYVFNKLKQMDFKVFINDNHTGIWIFWGHIPSYIDTESTKKQESLITIQNKTIDAPQKNNDQYRDINDNSFKPTNNFIYDFDQFQKK